MDDGGGVTANVARAIATAMDWRSPSEAKKTALSYLESIKNGDVRQLGNASFTLLRKDWSPEIRLHGLKMLQHLVRLRWEELSSEERRNFASTAVGSLSGMSDPQEAWALKSQTASLIAEIVRREGLELWQELLPSLVSLSEKGPVEAELVAMLLRWLPEDITVHYEDLEGDRRRSLLRGLTQSLPQILPLLYCLLERHFTGAFNEASRQQFDLAKQHAATVTAALNAVNAYAEWAPVPELSKYKLIDVCGFFLSSVDFRVHACEFFKLVCQRKRPGDDTAQEFENAMRSTFGILMNTSGELLRKLNSDSAGADEGEIRFAECICESMVALGSSFMPFIADDENVLSMYLQQMLVYFQHYKFTLHLCSLHIWLLIMKDLASKVKTSTQAVEALSAEKVKDRLKVLINDDICSSILDVSLRRMLKNTAPSGAEPSETIELWSSDLDAKIEFSHYRAKLLELVRLVALYRPVIAAAKVSHRVEASISAYMTSSVPPKGLSLLENMQLGLETVVGAIFEESILLSHTDEVNRCLRNIIEGLLQQLLGLKWIEPTLAEILGRYLDAFGPFLRLFPEAVGCVINKLFDLLTSIPPPPEDSCATSARHARLQICTSFLRIAKASDKSILPHMKGIADTMAYLQGEGRLLRGEHNVLAEAFLIMASSAGIQQQQEVLAWLLEPLSKQWTNPEWQNSYLSDPAGMKLLCADPQAMWSIFHNVTFFEKAFRRVGAKKGGYEGPTSQHPMSSHLPWMMPPLLRLIRSIHALWAYPDELRAAMSISPAEQACLLGEYAEKSSKSQPGPSEYSPIKMNTEVSAVWKESNIRNWLKGIRDTSYSVLGLSIMTGEGFFNCVEISSFSLALMENIQAMEFRHIRQLIHLVLVPFVKSCPENLWGEWVEKILYPLFIHCQKALTYSWSGLIQEGRAKVPDIFGDQPGPDLKVEVMQEKLLRDLTREICLLLSLIASPARNKGIPSVEQLSSICRAELSSLKALTFFASGSMTAFVLSRKILAGPVLGICREALTWTDGEAVSKVVPFCGALVLVSVCTDDMELKAFVARDLFYSVVQSLGLESNAVTSSDLISLCREIFIYFSERDPAPRQVLLSLPCVRPDDLAAFEDAISKTSSVKEQKQLMKSLLMLAAGNKLKAIVQQRTANVITNISGRQRGAAAPISGPPGVEDEAIGLSAIT